MASRLAAAFWFFPEERAFYAMKNEGVTYVMVHLERFGPEADGVLSALALRTDVELVAKRRRRAPPLSPDPVAVCPCAHGARRD